MENESGRRLAELKRSGASGIHGDRRLKKLRSRAAQKADAINRSRDAG